MTALIGIIAFNSFLSDTTSRADDDRHVAGELSIHSFLIRKPYSFASNNSITSFQFIPFWYIASLRRTGQGEPAFQFIPFWYFA